MNIEKSVRVSLAMKGVKRNQLASALGIADQSISNWMNRGWMTKKNFLAVCEYFEVPASEFIKRGE